MMFTSVKTDSEIKAMRESGRMLATVLSILNSKVQPDMSTKQLAEIAKQELRSLGGQPTFLGYNGFPDVLCVSVNDEIVHGIPSKDKIIEEGDLVSLDFGVTYKGMITDSAITTIVGASKLKDQQLVNDTYESLMAGIGAVHDHVRVGDISYSIQKVLDKNGYGIVKDLVGHGVGHHLHEDPNIPNYGKKGEGPILYEGMTIAIEPMATLGADRVKVDNDQWTVRSVDGSRSAHFEHTILVTKNGAEILTKTE